MKIRFDRDGTARTIYGEEINLAKLGVVELRRASHVDPTRELTEAAYNWLLEKYEKLSDHLISADKVRDCQKWWADMLPMNGPVLGPFATRSEALQAEMVWIDEHGIYKNFTHENNQTEG
jgi:hypothetical protein